MRARVDHDSGIVPVIGPAQVGRLTQQSTVAGAKDRNHPRSAIATVEPRIGSGYDRSTRDSPRPTKPEALRMSTHDPSETSDAPPGTDPTSPSDPSADATLADTADAQVRMSATDPNAYDGVAPGLTLLLPEGDLPPDLSPPSPLNVPGYDLLATLGEGGMGVVWEGPADQAEPGRGPQDGPRRAPGRKEGPDPVPGRGRSRRCRQASARRASVRIWRRRRPAVPGDGIPSRRRLTDRLKQTGRQSPLAAAKLVGTLAGAVQAAHDLGIVHRDLKPGNVLYDEHGQPKVTDFGLAKRAGGSDLTTTQVVMGTPAYMAPEQARGDTKFVGPQADVYSLGVILYECLTGRRPFDAPDQQALLRKVMEDET